MTFILHSAGQTDHDEARVIVDTPSGRQLEIVITHEGMIVNEIDMANGEIVLSGWEMWSDVEDRLS